MEFDTLCKYMKLIVNILFVLLIIIYSNNTCIYYVLDKIIRGGDTYASYSYYLYALSKKGNKEVIRIQERSDYIANKNKITTIRK